MRCANCGTELSETDGTPRYKRPATRPGVIEPWCERCGIWFPSAGDEGRVVNPADIYCRCGHAARYHEKQRLFGTDVCFVDLCECKQFERKSEKEDDDERTRG